MSPKPPESETHRRTQTKPAIPVIPALPQIQAQKSKPAPEAVPNGEPATAAPSTSSAPGADGEVQSPQLEEEPKSPEPSVKAAPKSWADLVRSKAAAAANAKAAMVNGAGLTNGAGPTRSGTMSEVLSQFDVNGEHKFAFLEPRGLVNTGNMCYMNSVRSTETFG